MLTVLNLLGRAFAMTVAMAIRIVSVNNATNCSLHNAARHGNKLDAWMEKKSCLGTLGRDGDRNTVSPFVLVGLYVCMSVLLSQSYSSPSNRMVSDIPNISVPSATLCWLDGKLGALNI